MANSTSWISEELQKLADANLSITFREIQSPIEAHIRIDDRDLLNFASNNYLGLANHESLRNAAKKAIDTYGIGPAAVRTIAGTTTLHKELEIKLAEFKKTQDVIVFQGGFIANIAVIPALVGEEDTIFSDELNHASIIDACKLSKAKVVRFAHADTKDLEEKLKETTGTRRKLIVTDGVFSMDGDIAPLPEIVELAEKYNAMTLVDDAHGEGVLGESGRGIVDHFGLHGRVDVEIGTMSKAFGVVGGTASGKKLVIDWLRQRARPFLFSSAMTVPDVAACIAAIDLLKKSDGLVKKLWDNASLLRNGLQKAGFDTGHSQTPIIPVMLGDEKLAKEFSRKLFENGLFAVGITFPTVALGKARVRVMNSAAHSDKDISKAIEIFSKVGKELKVI